jgi:glycosyltransferase involved in cell wall biosynthesis
MRILVVSFRFPPYNSVGAVSVGKTVKYLIALGHDVRVVTARDQQLPGTVPLEIDARSVVSTGWVNPMRLAQPAVGGGARVEATGFSAGRKHARAIHRVGRVYRSTMIPDGQIGWTWPALRAGRRIVDRWRPDVIYASAPPFTSLIVASALAFRTGIPWVAGLRDLWSDNPYRRIRLASADRALESRVLRSAAGVVATTDEARDVVRTRFRVPTVTVMNGFDPEDLRDRTIDPDPAQLRIVHTGALIHDRRDPTPLFDAMRTVRSEGRTIMAEFYGRDSVVVAKDAERAAVGDLVHARGPVSYHVALQIQRDADVLLLLQPIDADELGICPAKVFEYAAARRPVLAIGPKDGVAARLIANFGLGVHVQHAGDIEPRLRAWCDAKSGAGRLPDVAERPPNELSRRTQVQKLSDFLEDLVPC